LVPSIIRLSSSSWFRFRSCNIDMREASSADVASVSVFLSAC
jgi:hypothetical protein